MPWGMVDIHSVISLKKTDFPFPRRYQLLRVGRCVHFHFPGTYNRYFQRSVYRALVKFIHGRKGKLKLSGRDSSELVSVVCV